MPLPRLTRPAILATVALLSLLAIGCGPVARNSNHSPASSPSPKMPGLLGLAGVAPGPLSLMPPYQVQGRLGSGPGSVPSLAVPSTPTAAVSQLAQALGVPGPPIRTATGLGYNLGATEGYQLTTDAELGSFNFHPNTPTDEVGRTPTVAGAEQFAESFLASHKVPEGGGVTPLPQLSYANGSDRRVFFDWTLEGLPVVNILGQPQEIYVDVATDQFQVTQLVGMSGAVPYGGGGHVVAYPAMSPGRALAYLNRGTIKPGSYLLDGSLRPFPPSPGDGAGVTVTKPSLAMVVSYGTAVPVYVFPVLGNAQVQDFVTCAVPPQGCVPLRFRAADSPAPTPSG